MNTGRKCAIFGAAAGFFLQAALLLLLLMSVALDENFYFAEYRAHGVYERCGAPAETLDAATDIITGYLRGTREDMSGIGCVDGEIREIFSQDEKDHMKDVRGLFVTAYVVLGLSAVLALVCVLCMRGDRKKATRGFLCGMGLFALAIAVLAALIALDFNAAFLTMHKLLFRNGLWRMTWDEFMIRMFPEEFFSDACVRIGLRYLGAIAAEILLLTGGKRKEISENDV